MPPSWKRIIVTATASVALGANKNRTTSIICNLSTNTIYWDHHQTVTILNGGPILPNQYVILEEDSGDFTHEPIWVIAAGPDNDARVYEATGQTRLNKIFEELR